MKSDVLSIIAVLLVAFFASSTASRERGIRKSLNKAQKQCQKYGDGCEFSTEVFFNVVMTSDQGMELSAAMVNGWILNDANFSSEVVAAAKTLLEDASPVVHLNSVQKGKKGNPPTISLLLVDGPVAFSFYKDHFLTLWNKYNALIEDSMRALESKQGRMRFALHASPSLPAPLPNAGVGGSHCSPCGCGRTWKGCCGGYSCQVETNSGRTYNICKSDNPNQPNSKIYGPIGCCNGAPCFNNCTQNCYSRFYDDPVCCSPFIQYGGCVALECCTSNTCGDTCQDTCKY